MPTEDHGEAAIKELDGALLDGRNIKVNKARPKGDKPAGGGGGRSRRPPGGGGGGGRY
jgi:RNA recognition motif-containing protein